MAGISVFRKRIRKMSLPNNKRGGAKKLKCPICKKDFLRFKSWVNKDNKKTNYCSAKCSFKSKKSVLKKKCKICLKQFEVRKSEASKYVTCSTPRCRKKNKLGKNNPNWKHGRGGEKRDRSTKKYREWRTAVFERDGYACVFGGKAHGKELQADHIRPWAYFPTLRFNVDNGRTLCVECHRTTFKDVFAGKPRTYEEYQLLANNMGSDALSWLCVDFDDVIAHNSGKPYYLPTTPLDGAKDALVKLEKDGWKIIIYTARSWADYNTIEAWLDANSIPYRRIICGKPLGKYIIDDRNVEFKGDWKKTLKKIK